MCKLKYIKLSVLIWLIAAFTMLYASVSHAGLPINSINTTSLPGANAQFEYFEDIDVAYDFERIIALPDEHWLKAEEGHTSFGFSDSQFWLRLNIINAAINTNNLVLEIAYPILDDTTFYLINQNGSVRALDTGDTKPFYPRDIEHPNMLMRFQLEAGESVDIYARAKTKGSMILPVKIWQENDFFEFAAREQQFHFFYYGCLFIIILINLAMFFTLREKLYLYYSLATTGYLLFFITARGYGQQLIFPEYPALNSQLFLSSMPLLALFSLLFAREFLQTKQHSPVMDMAIRGMIYFEYFNMVAAVVLDYNTAVKVSAVSALVLFVVLFLAGPVSWRAKNREGVFFTIAWLPLTLGFVATVGRASGFLPDNFFTEYAMQLGSGLEAFILTLALADRLYREREEKLLAQTTNIQKEQQQLITLNQLSEAMMRDPITNLANRNRFEWLANKRFSEQPDEGFVIFVTRITRINEITRTLGITSVERILTTIGGLINQSINNLPGVITTQSSQGYKDATFQLTGDTFGALVQKSIFDENLEQYQKLIQKLFLPINAGLLSIELEPRIGCAVYPAHGLDAAKLIRNALVAMESSHHAADQIGYYDHTLDIYNESRLTLMSDLREALKNDGPDLHYQPKLSLKNDTIVGLEALIRWQHPQQGLVAPDNFIPLAEQTGVITDLTLWAIERAAKDLLRLRDTGYCGNMSINISAKDLLSEQLKDQIETIFEKYQIDPSKIFLELTETAAMDEPEVGLAALNQLAALGLKVSIDDFGAGYSSLSYLKQLPASEVKLDRSLILGITSSESSRIIVKASIDMAHALGYKVVTEGVEDTETYQLMKELGCDELQGFWLCKPKSLTDIEDWLSSR